MDEGAEQHTTRDFEVEGEIAAADFLGNADWLFGIAIGKYAQDIWRWMSLPSIFLL